MSARGSRPFVGRRGRLLPGDGPLARVHPLVVFVVVAAVFAAGAIVGGTLGFALLILLAAAVAVLLATTWPRLAPRERVLRVLVLAVLVVVAFGVWWR